MPIFVHMENHAKGTDSNVNKPSPIPSIKKEAAFPYVDDFEKAIKKLEEGKPVLVTGFYSNGLLLLKELHSHLERKFKKATFQEERILRAEFQKLSNLILIEIVAHKLAVKKAPSIGWLEKLYPESGDFLLPFPQVQGLNSAWQWYKNGISIPVLRNKIHPYYGTYFPTRFDHLILFDNWLKHYEGPKKSAIDVGVGSGILSLQMVKHGFQKVYGTDTNPNAIIGLKEFMGTTILSRKIELDLGNLFGKWDKKTELIVFNPPWLPQTYAIEKIDTAIYYDENLFPEFFKEAKQRLLPEGKMVIIFSNLAEITGATTAHPIRLEIAEGGRFKLERCFKKTVKTASLKTTRDLTRRATEEVELWVLTH